MFIKISTLLRASIKKNEISTQLNVSRVTKTFQGLRVPTGSSLIRKTSSYKSRSHQKDLPKQPLPENNKTGIEEENFILLCAQDDQRDRRKSLEVC